MIEISDFKIFLLDPCKIMKVLSNDACPSLCRITCLSICHSNNSRTSLRVYLSFCRAKEHHIIRRLRKGNSEKFIILDYRKLYNTSVKYFFLYFSKNKWNNFSFFWMEIKNGILYVHSYCVALFVCSHIMTVLMQWS